jgi:hypothetical protein|tara:strand:+ start:541 stop:786 length:246 start_codon:yes stop_codon:yes gene_type:complete
MKYTLVKRTKFKNLSQDIVSTVKSSDSLDGIIKMKIGAEMLEGKLKETESFEILINIDDAYKYISSSLEEPLLLTKDMEVA